MDSRAITLLDGDTIRAELSKDLGFSRNDREENMMRVRLIASDITKEGGIVICSFIAPYQISRQANRDEISKFGGYIEIYLSTPLEICEQRDVKGLYAKARKGLINSFTGISDPYEVPKEPEITIDTSETNPKEVVQKILHYLKEEGYILG